MHNNLRDFQAPCAFLKISYIILKLAVAILWETRNVRRSGAMSSDKCMKSAASLLQGTSLCTCLGHILHKPKKFQTKVFFFIYLHKFKMIFTASSKFWPRVKKMHLNFGTCPYRQEADPNSIWARNPRARAGSQEELKEFFSQFTNLVQWDLQADTCTTEMQFHLTGTCPFHYLLSLLLSHAALRH